MVWESLTNIQVFEAGYLYRVSSLDFNGLVFPVLVPPINVTAPTQPDGKIGWQMTNGIFCLENDIWACDSAQASFQQSDKYWQIDCTLAQISRRKVDFQPTGIFWTQTNGPHTDNTWCPAPGEYTIRHSRAATSDILTLTGIADGFSNISQYCVLAVGDNYQIAGIAKL